MRQRITEKQWNEINNSQKKILMEGIGRHDENIALVGFLINLPSIGEMLKFLGDHYKDLHVERNEHDGEWGFSTCKEDDRFTNWEHQKELVDILWAACCYVLKK